MENKELIRKLKSHKTLIHNGETYYHVGKSFIARYIKDFEDVNNYKMVQKQGKKRLYERPIC